MWGSLCMSSYPQPSFSSLSCLLVPYRRELAPFTALPSPLERASQGLNRAILCLIAPAPPWERILFKSFVKTRTEMKRLCAQSWHIGHITWCNLQGKHLTREKGRMCKMPLKGVQVAILEEECHPFSNKALFMSLALLDVIQLNPHSLLTSYGPKLVSQAHLHLMFNLPPDSFIWTTPCVGSNEMKRIPHFRTRMSWRRLLSAEGMPIRQRGTLFGLTRVAIPVLKKAMVTQAEGSAGPHSTDTIQLLGGLSFQSGLTQIPTSWL